MSFLWTPRRHNAGFLTIQARRPLLSHFRIRTSALQLEPSRYATTFHPAPQINLQESQNTPERAHQERFSNSPNNQELPAYTQEARQVASELFLQ